jgi:hypothetical protein
VAIDPFHHIVRLKRQNACTHSLKADADRVEVAARVGRTVHSPGRVGRRGGERAGDRLERVRGLACRPSHRSAVNRVGTVSLAQRCARLKISMPLSVAHLHFDCVAYILRP